MPDSLSFAEGRARIVERGLPSLCYFLLSELGCADMSESDTLAGGLGEISGTGYKRAWTQAPPVSGDVGAAIDFPTFEWSTGSASDWSAEVRSAILVSSPDDSGVAIMAWNLLPDARPRDLSAPATTQRFTTTLVLA